jgi:hypothetical protein
VEVRVAHVEPARVVIERQVPRPAALCCVLACACLPCACLERDMIVVDRAVGDPQVTRHTVGVCRVRAQPLGAGALRSEQRTRRTTSDPARVYSARLVLNVDGDRSLQLTPWTTSVSEVVGVLEAVEAWRAAEVRPAPSVPTSARDVVAVASTDPVAALAPVSPTAPVASGPSSAGAPRSSHSLARVVPAPATPGGAALSSEGDAADGTGAWTGAGFGLSYGFVAGLETAPPVAMAAPPPVSAPPVATRVTSSASNGVAD